MIPSIDRTRSTRVTVLAVAVLLSALALSMAFTGSAAAAVDSAERNISSTEAPNGTTVTVTVNATFDTTTSEAQINDQISPNISASNVVITDSGSVPAYQESTGTITSSYFGVKSATLTYEVTIPADTSVGTTYDFANGTVVDREAGDEISISGDETITVIEGDGGGDDPSSPDDSPSGDGSIVSAERTIDSEKAVAGDTVGVTVTANFDGTTSDGQINDQISPALNASQVAIVDGPTVTVYQESTGIISASFGGVSSESITYEVTIPSDASAGTIYDFSGGEVRNRETGAVSSIAGNSTIEVVSDPLVSYATPEGIIGPGGLGDAAADFRTGKIGPGTLGDVAEAFRTSKPVV